MAEQRRLMVDAFPPTDRPTPLAIKTGFDPERDAFIDRMRKSGRSIV